MHNGSRDFRLATSYGDVFNDLFRIYLLSAGTLYLSDVDTTYYNANIYLNNEGTAAILMGDNEGVTYLASGKSISIGDTGYAVKDLYLSKFHQLGSTTQTLNMTGSSCLFMKACSFEGKVSISAPGILCSYSIFDDSTTISKTGTDANYWYGSNVFNGKAVIVNTDYGNYRDVLRLSGTVGNIFNSDAFFQNEGKSIEVDFSDTTQFFGNISINNSLILFESNVILTGGEAQELTGTEPYLFANLTIDKETENITTDTILTVKGELTLARGNIITTNNNLLIMTSESSVSGASNNSFVCGPVKKYGDTEFLFPTGKESIYRPIGISAPDDKEDAFLAEYFNEEQTLGIEFDSSLGYLSPCNYWSCNRVNGESEVIISLSWDSTYCSINDTTELRTAYFSEDTWIDLGHGIVSGNYKNGSMLSTDLINEFGYFALSSGSAGTGATYLICDDHGLQSWGQSMLLGDGSLINDFDPHLPTLPNGSQVVSVASGGGFTIALLSDGTVYSWGINNFGQLGNGTTTASSIPIQVSGIPGSGNAFLGKVVAIAAGQDHALALLCNSRVVAWGRNNSIQLGNNGAGLFSTTPVYVLTNSSAQLTNVKSIAAGSFHSLFLLDNGNVISCGNNTQGELGIGNNALQTTREFVQDPTGLDDLANIVLISAGGFVSFVNGARTIGATSYAVDVDGNLLSWGSNSLGQIGNGTSGSIENLPVVTGISDVISVDAGNTHTIAIIGPDRELICWGGNASGQIGNNTSGGIVTTPFTIPGISGIVKASAGDRFNIIVDNNGDVYTWGINNVFQLGMPNNLPLDEATQVTSNGLCNPLLPCDLGMSYCFQNITIATGSPVTWDLSSNPAISPCSGVLTIENTLKISAGAHLIIDGINVGFGPEGNIIVDRGDGTLPAGILELINGAHLDAASNDCMWEGIQVYGYYNQSQEDLSAAPPYYNDQQGRLEMSGSFIDNAHIGIYTGRKFIPECSGNSTNYTGGIIRLNTPFASYNNFLNNNISIEFPVGFNSTTTVLSTLNSSIFECSDAMRDPIYQGERSQCFIKMTEMGRVIINSCSFSNSGTIVSNHTSGILQYNCSDFKVVGCGFNFLDYGINLLNSGSNSLSTGGMISSSAYSCSTGVHILQRNNISISGSVSLSNNNSFSSSIGGKAILNENSKNVMFSGNIITGYDYGITVINSGQNMNLLSYITQNDIDNSLIALNAGGRNYYTKWLCNYLYNYGVGFQIYPVGGITNIQSQGLCNAPTSNPAGNWFDLISPNTNLDINNLSPTFNFSYVYHQNPSDVEYIPDQISTSSVSVSSCPSGLDEIAFCDLPAITIRDIVDIISERDTVTDTLSISRINGEAYNYYCSNNMIDSAIWYLETYGIDEINDLLIPLYIQKGEIGTALELIAILADTTEELQNKIDYLELLCNLKDDERTFFDLTDEEITFINLLAESNNEIGRSAQVILNMLFNIPLSFPCEYFGSCEERHIKENILPNSFDSSKESILIFPNPAIDITSIQFPKGMTINHGAKLKLVDMSGKIVYLLTLKTGDTKIEIDLTNLHNGIYILQLQNELEFSNMGKIVILHE